MRRPPICLQLTSRSILLLLFLCAAASLPFAAAQTTNLHGNAHHHTSACDADDARCLALQSDVCDPWNTTATDKCTFVQVDEYCMEDVNRINYLALFYCNNKVGMIFAGLAWLILLFFVMTITAEIFLCPAIEFLANRMGMAPDIAGVTLFAFASGAPDLFTQVAALAAGDHVDIELAVSATFGGGLFIICVVLASVILASNGDLVVPDRRSYIRDSSAYMVSTLLTLGLLLVGFLSAIDGLILLGMYFVYLAICLRTRSTTVGNEALGQPSGGGGGRNSTPHSNGNGVMAHGGDYTLTDAELEMVPFTLEVVNDPATPRGLHTLSPKKSGPALVLQDQEAVVSKSSNKLVTGENVDPKVLRARAGTTLPSQPNTSTTTNSPPMVTVFTDTPALQPNSGNTLQRTTSMPLWDALTNKETLKEFVREWWSELPHTIDEMLHLHGKSGFRRYFAYCTAPIVIFMHCTMPAVSTGTFSMGYTAILSVTAPAFFLLTANMGPAVVGWGTYSTIWFSSTLVLMTLAFAVHPVDSPANVTPGFIIPSSPSSGQISNTYSSTGTSGGGGHGNAAHSGQSHPSPRFGGHSTITSPDNFLIGGRPRKCLLFAIIAFLQCILWLNATAEEVVSIFEAIGRIWNIRRDTLGATVLAWGETVPDLVAVLSLSKAGQGTMAIAACFGGPVFNLLISMGGPILVAGLKSGSIDYQMTSGVMVLIASTVIILIALLVSVPTRYQWKLQKELGWALLGFYAVSQIIFLISEGIVLW